MNVTELQTRLEDEGCNPRYYAINGWGHGDNYCLVRKGDEWVVFYTERGTDYPPMFSSQVEAEACEFLLHKLLSMRHDHCVGFYRTEEAARKLAFLLKKNDIAHYQDDIPYSSATDRRYRVFVTGKTIHPAKALLGEVPLRD